MAASILRPLWRVLVAIWAALVTVLTLSGTEWGKAFWEAVGAFLVARWADTRGWFDDMKWQGALALCVVAVLAVEALRALWRRWWSVAFHLRYHGVLYNARVSRSACDIFEPPVCPKCRTAIHRRHQAPEGFADRYLTVHSCITPGCGYESRSPNEAFGGTAVVRAFLEAEVREGRKPWSRRWEAPFERVERELREKVDAARAGRARPDAGT
jgi:hypothetical protein